MKRLAATLALGGLVWSTAAAGQTPFFQTQVDDYTRYELLDPGSSSFRILYDVSATTAGATYYFNGLRAGSEHVIHGVQDLMTGEPLAWRVVDGEQARLLGMENARPSAEYLAVTLARPVPPGGQARIRIDKTYRDTASYYAEGDLIWFDRSLGINRNAVVLPPGFELLEVNFPSQVVTEASGRVKVSFMNAGPVEVPYRVRGRRMSETPVSTSGDREPPPGETTMEPVPSGARVGYRFSERAYEDRDITYFLQAPETHAFRLYHDYTETRPGMDRYLNVVREGSKASNPSAKILDTGEELVVETLQGRQITDRGINLPSMTDGTEVVVIWFDPVAEGHSVRLRIEETYTDPNRYLMVGDELVWDRSFGRARNTVILPDGWYLTANAIPAVITETEDGRIRLRYINDRPGNIDVFIKARRRPAR